MLPTHIALRRSAPAFTDSRPLDCSMDVRSRRTGALLPMSRAVFQNCASITNDSSSKTARSIHPLVSQPASIYRSH